MHTDPLAIAGVVQTPATANAPRVGSNWLLGQIEYCYYMYSVPRLLWASLVGLNRAERVPKSSSLSLQYFVHANDMAILGWHTRAEKYYRASIELAQQLNDRRLAAVPISHHALGCVAAAKYDEGVDKLGVQMAFWQKVTRVQRHRGSE
jgi:hypothetical protein